MIYTIPQTAIQITIMKAMIHGELHTNSNLEKRQRHLSTRYHAPYFLGSYSSFLQKGVLITMGQFLTISPISSRFNRSSRT